MRHWPLAASSLWVNPCLCITDLSSPERKTVNVQNFINLQGSKTAPQAKLQICKSWCKVEVSNKVVEKENRGNSTDGSHLSLLSLLWVSALSISMKYPGTQLCFWVSGNTLHPASPGLPLCRRCAGIVTATDSRKKAAQGRKTYSIAALNTSKKRNCYLAWCLHLSSAVSKRQDCKSSKCVSFIVLWKYCLTLWFP